MRLLSWLIADAVLLAGCAVDVASTVCSISTVAEVEASYVEPPPAAEPTPGGAAVATVPDRQQLRQVLTVTQDIPEGLTMRELVEAPTVYLSARAVSEQFVCPTTISTVAQLVDLERVNSPGSSTVIMAGRFLDTRQFSPAG